MQDKIRAAGYVRVSTLDQARDGLSLGEQEHRIRAYIEARGWELVNVYDDGGVSATKLPALADRPAGGRLVSDAADLDRLIIAKLDRLGRSARELLEAMERLEVSGCAVVSLSEGIDTSTPVGRLTRTILAAVAEFERDRIAERQRDAAHAKARAGRPHGGQRPYGYDFAGQGGLTVVKHEAVVVRRIFASWIAGTSLLGIARELEREGVPTRRRGHWRASTISQIIRNPI